MKDITTTISRPHCCPSKILLTVQYVHTQIWWLYVTIHLSRSTWWDNQYSWQKPWYVSIVVKTASHFRSAHLSVYRSCNNSGKKSSQESNDAERVISIFNAPSESISCIAVAFSFVQEIRYAEDSRAETLALLSCPISKLVWNDVFDRQDQQWHQFRKNQTKILKLE